MFDSLDRVRRPWLALALLVPAPTIGALMALWLAPGPVGQGVYGFAKAWLLGLPLVWTLFIDRRPLLGQVRSARRSWRDGLGVGVTLGIAISIIIIAAFEMLRGVVGIDGTELKKVATAAGFGTPTTYILFGAYLALVNSLLEEYVWRWFVFRACASVMPAWLGVIVSGLCFTAHHVVVLAAYFPASITALGSLGVFIGGCTWSWCYLRYRSVWPGYVSHILVDVAILYIGWRLLFH